MVFRRRDCTTEPAERLWIIPRFRLHYRRPRDPVGDIRSMQVECADRRLPSAAAEGHVPGMQSES